VIRGEHYGILRNDVTEGRHIPKIAQGLRKLPLHPLHFPFVFQRSYLDTVTYAGKSTSEKATGFAATTRYSRYILISAFQAGTF
jgi:hypothetical protein